MADLLSFGLISLVVAGLLFSLWQWRRVRRLEDRIERGLDGMGAALWEWDIVTGTIHLSELCLEIIGYQRAEFSPDADTFLACFHPDDRAETEQAFTAYLDHQTSQCVAELRVRRQDGRYLWMRLRAVGTWDSQGRPLTLAGSFSDITSKAEGEEERDRLFNLSTDMLSVVGFNQYLQQINPAWVRVLGWSRDELMGFPILHFIHPADQETSIAAWEQLCEGTPVEGLESRFRCRDGSFRWLSWGSFPYVDRQVVFSVVRDITSQKKAEQQLIEYHDRLRLLSSQLALVEDRQRRELAVAIHDGLAQQLFGIRAQMVLLKYPEKVPDLAGVVAQIIEILDETMVDTRNLSFELFPPVLYEVGLEAALEWLAHNFSERTGVACTSETEGEGVELPEDQRSMAYQCVRELLANINKHAGANSARISLDYVDQFLTVLVEDDGVGFDVQTLERPQGTVGSSGFGLFSIRERLRSVDGRVLVDSKVGQGTRVFLSFPYGRDQVPGAELPVSDG